MELLILVYACKTSMSKTITVIMPYLPYSKQCRMLRRSSIPMKLIAEMICKAGRFTFIVSRGPPERRPRVHFNWFTLNLILIFSLLLISGAGRLVSLDLYKKEIQGFFSIPVDNLRASPFLLQYIKEYVD